MVIFQRTIFAAALLCGTAVAARAAGPYPPAAGQSGATAIAATDPRLVEWASGATIARGMRNIENPAAGKAFYGGLDGGTLTGGASSANNAPIGEPPQPQQTSYCVALGQGGAATVTFAQPIMNGPGVDFAVFGNGFAVSSTAEWVKPAFVEVSSDGVDFFRFPSVSLTPASPQISSGGALDPTNLYDLAGKDPIGWGTPFDLSELAGVSALLNVNDIIAVRLVDCVDDINPEYARLDSQGHIVNGPWQAGSAIGSEGFNLAGVGVINAVPEPGALSLLIAAAGAFFFRRRSTAMRRSVIQLSSSIQQHS